MQKKVAIIVSPNYQDYAKIYLTDCLESLRRQDWNGEKKIFITDNQSTSETYLFLTETAPEAEIIRNENNDGFAEGNNKAIRLAIAQRFDYIFLVNMDTVVATDCVTHLVETAEGDGTIGAVQARLMLWPETDKINSLGNVTHFLGFGYCEGYGEEFSSAHLQSAKCICYPSGAAALYKREVLERIGLFDEEFWMYNEDQDLGWRTWLAGSQCVLAPKAIVYHKYVFTKHTGKYYLLDRNRILTMIKNYHIATLLLISFAFVVMEFGMLLFAFQKGWLREKLNVYRYFLSFKNWRYILRARKATQALRQVKDRDIVKMFSGRIWYEEIGDWKLVFVNHVLSLYWNIIKWILRIEPGAIH
jgi:GT2 family glycosyltransferase